MAQHDEWLNSAMQALAAEASAPPAPSQEQHIAERVAIGQAMQNDWADAALQQLGEYSKDPTAGERALSVAQGVGTGALGFAKNTLVDFPRNVAGVVRGGLETLTGRDLPENQGDVATSLIERGITAAQSAIEPSLRVRDSTVYQAAEMGGYVLPALATALAGASTTAAVVGATQQGGQSGLEAREAGAGPLSILGATAAGYVVGGTALMPLEVALSRINSAAGGALLRNITGAAEASSASMATKSLVRGAATTAIGATEAAGVGAASGVAYTALVNAIHDWATGDDIALFEGAEKNAMFGAALVGMIRGATEAAVAKRHFTGRKFTEAGWEGPELGRVDYAAMSEPVKAAELGGEGGFAPPITPTRDEFFQPGVDHATKQLTVELNTRSIPWSADTADLAMIVQDEYGLPPDKARAVAAQAQVNAAEQAWSEHRARMERETKNAELKALIEEQKRAAQEQSFLDEIERSKAQIAFDAEGQKLAAKNQAKREAEAAARQAQIAEASQRWQAENDRLRAEESGRAWDAAHPETGAEPASRNWAQLGEDLAAAEAFKARVAEAKIREEAAARGAAEANAAWEGARKGAGSAFESPAKRAMRSFPTKIVEGRTLVMDVGSATNRGTELWVTLEDTYGAKGVALREDFIRAATSAAQKLSSFVIRTGLVPSHALGLYDPATKEARIAKYGDMPTAAHEAGHAIEMTAFGMDGGISQAANWDKIRPELVKLGRELYGPDEPHNGYASEGFAEFSRIWMLQHEDLMRVAPEMTKWFDQEFLAHPERGEFKAAMLNARTVADQYRFQGSAKRTQTVDPTSWAMRFRRSSLGELGQKLLGQWLDAAQPLYEFAREIEKRGYLIAEPLKAVQIAVGTRATADSKLRDFVRYGTVDYTTGDVNGPSYRDVVAPMKGNRADFNSYLALRAAKWRNEVKGHDMPFPDVDVDWRIATLEAKHPQIKATSDALLAWYDRVLNYVAQSNPTLAHGIALMRQEGEFYMPLRRWGDWYDSKMSAPSSGAKRAASKGQTATKAKGSKLEIVDPDMALLVEARRILQIGIERRVQEAVLHNSKVAGVPDFVADVTNRVLSMIGEQPFAAGEPYGAPLDGWASMQMLSTSSIQHPDGPIVPFKQALPNGGFEIRYYQFEPKLHAAIMSLDPNNVMQAFGAWGTTFRFFKNSFVLGATGLNASFGLLKNPIRDAQSLYVNSKNAPHLASLIPQLMYEHARTALHELTDGRVAHYAWADAYNHKLYLDTSDRYATFTSAKTQARSALRTGVSRVINIDTPANIVHVLAHVMQISEKATRIWEIKRTAERVGWKPGERMTPEQAVQMAADARQVTVDFTAGGSIATQINQFVPFFNVAVQAPRSTVRAAIHHPKDFAIRNAAIMGMGALLWWKFKDEDWMKAMPASERWGYWYYPFTSPSGEKILARIPVAPEQALAAKTFEFAIEAMRDKDHITVDEYMKNLWNVYTPEVVPPLAMELAQQAANRSRLTLNPADWSSNKGEIVPERLANADDPTQEFRPQTGRFATKVAEVLNISPLRVEHAMKNLFAGVGSSAADASFFGLLEPRVTLPGQASDMTVIGALARKDGPVSMRSRYVDQAYTLAEVADRAFKANPTAETKRAQLALRGATQMISLAGAMADSGKLSRLQIQKLYSAMNEVARDVVEQVQSGSNVNPTPALQAAGQLKGEAARLGIKR